jgi:hypothetical protein
MTRNGVAVPLLALAAGVICFFVARILALHAAPPAPGTPAHLSVMQLGFVAFGTTLLLYGIAGFGSIWLHGVELRPGASRLRPRGAIVLVELLLCVTLANFAGAFVYLVRASGAGATVDASTVGGVGGAVFLLVAVLLVLYAKFFMRNDVEIEKEPTVHE